MKRKLKNNRGETLIEALASILIGALSVALLFTAVMASASMDRAADKSDDAYNAVLNKAERQSDTDNDKADPSIVPYGTKVTVRNPDVVGSAEILVNFYGGDGALSYKLPSP